jgi:hypothetical protein
LRFVVPSAYVARWGADWTPQTVGWYVIFAITGVLILWMIIRSLRRWLANAYRRQALRELTVVPPEQLSTLLKRTALAAWPREKVASLSGEAWLRFLDESGGSDAFQRSPANRVEEITLRPASLSSEDEHLLRAAVSAWIRRHRVQA